MKLYHIDITIHNDLGEMVDARFSFETLEEMANKMGEKMFVLIDGANDFAKQNGRRYEELEDELGRDPKEKDTYEPEDILKAHEDFVKDLNKIVGI